jgi:hypothetical protein
MEILLTIIIGFLSLIMILLLVALVLLALFCMLIIFFSIFPKLYPKWLDRIYYKYLASSYDKYDYYSSSYYTTTLFDIRTDADKKKEDTSSWDRNNINNLTNF